MSFQLSHLYLPIHCENLFRYTTLAQSKQTSANFTATIVTQQDVSCENIEQSTKLYLKLVIVAFIGEEFFNAKESWRTII